MSEMPDTIAPAPVQPIAVNLTFRRAKGQCLMVVDARGLHDYLNLIGVARTEDGSSFKDGPGNMSAIVSPSYNRIEPGALLKCNGPHEFSLLPYYTNCPSAEIMRELSASLDGTIHKIVEHYRPIEISVIIHLKPGKG